MQTWWVEMHELAGVCCCCKGFELERGWVTITQSSTTLSAVPLPPHNQPLPNPPPAPPQLVNNKGELKIADFGLARYFRKVC